MNYSKFKRLAKALAMQAGMQYTESPEGDIWLSEDTEDGDTKSWIAEKGHDGEITRVFGTDGDKEWRPEVWLLLFDKRNELEEDNESGEPD